MENRTYKIGRLLRGLVWMLSLAGLVVLFLALVNWLPSFRGAGYARQYRSVDEAKQSLKLHAVTVPGFFPEGISWPPFFVLAQMKPYEAIVMEFRAERKKATELIVIQSSLLGRDEQLQRIRITQVKEETRYRLKGRNVLLQVGTCDNGVLCSKMSWQDNDIYHTVILMSSPFELIRIVESMIRQ